MGNQNPIPGWILDLTPRCRRSRRPIANKSDGGATGLRASRGSAGLRGGSGAARSACTHTYMYIRIRMYVRMRFCCCCTSCPRLPRVWTGIDPPHRRGSHAVFWRPNGQPGRVGSTHQAHQVRTAAARPQPLGMSISICSARPRPPRLFPLPPSRPAQAQERRLCSRVYSSKHMPGTCR